MQTVELTKGQFALIDDTDAEKVNLFWWYAFPLPTGKWWAMCQSKVGRPTRPASAHPHVSMHRFIMDAPKGMEVYHVNGNGLDNRRENLELGAVSEIRSKMSRAVAVRKAATAGRLVEGIDDRQGYVTIKDIMACTSVCERTARTYCKALLESDEWVKLPPAIMKNRGRGGQPMRITRAYRDETQ